jgi:hypothetical protein
MALSPEERASLPANMQVPERSSRKVVEHTPTGSHADMSDLEELVPTTYNHTLGMHALQQHIKCEATESDDGHSGPATHLIRMPGERSDQIEAVCAVHHARLVTNSLARGESASSRRIHADDVQNHLGLRKQQKRLKRTALEAPLHAAGLTGEDAIFGRKDEELGKGGGRGTTHIEELKSRRTPEHAHSVVEAALERVRAHGGHNPPPTATPTIDFNGEEVSLADSYSKIAALRRKETGSDGSVDGVAKSSTVYSFNKAGVPNPRGGRKKNNPQYDYDTSNEEKPGYTEEEMTKNPALRKSSEERAAAGIPVGGIKPRGFSKTNNKALKVEMTQLPKTRYPNQPVGALDDSAVINFGKKSQQRSTDRSIEDIELNAEGDRLREIEAKKAKTSSRNAAFRADWKDVPRPE